MRPRPPICILALFFALPSAAAAAGPVSAAAAGSVGEPGSWVARDAVTAIHFDRHTLSVLGMEVGDVATSAEAEEAGFLAFAAPKPWALYFSAPGGAFADFVGGNLRHLGGLGLTWSGGSASLAGFELRPAGRELTLELLDAQGRVLFFVDHIHALLDVAGQRLDLTNMDVRVSDLLAEKLGDARLAGRTIAQMSVRAAVDVPAGVDSTSGACDSPNWPPGTPADVGLSSINQVQQSAWEPGVRVAITPSATLRNVGQADVPWYEAFDPPEPPYNNDQHPYLVWALYRIADGRIEQLGQSGVKHAFFTINSSCTCTGGHILWVGCEDTYGVSTNQNRQWLAPRHEVSARTGIWQRCGSHFDQDCDGVRDHGGGSPHDDFEHRLVVAESDLATEGAEYYFEAWYIVRDDVNIFNTMGYRRVTPTSVANGWLFPMDAEFPLGPAVNAWVDPVDPGPNALNEMFDGSAGRVQVLTRASPIGGGVYRYEYAVMNHDFDRQIEGWRVPLPPGVTVSNPGFGDIDSDPTNDWQVTIAADAILWETPTPDDGLDWGTLFNFYFDAPVGPVEGTGAFRALEEGFVKNFDVNTLGPGPVGVFADDFESGDTTSW